MYRYIGNKTKLLPHIMNRVREMIGDTGTVADIMAGTGSVALELKKNGYTVIASDVMTYSYHHLVTNLQLDGEPPFTGLIFEGVIDAKSTTAYQDVLEFLNNLTPKQSFFYREFSPAGTPLNGCPPRKYFTAENAEKIDAIREKINEWIENGNITPNEESLLKHTLIMAVNEIANISGTYGYFLSDFKKNAVDPIVLKPVEIYTGNATGHIVRLGFAENLAGLITADLCYIDPPYMKRQYAANYHVLETLARGDYPEAIGTGDMPDDKKQRLAIIREALMHNRMFPEKVIKYLWDDAFKFNPEALFDTDNMESLEQVIRTFVYSRGRERFKIFKPTVRAFLYPDTQT